MIPSAAVAVVDDEEKGWLVGYYEDREGGQVWYYLREMKVKYICNMQ